MIIDNPVHPAGRYHSARAATCLALYPVRRSENLPLKMFTRLV